MSTPESQDQPEFDDALRAQLESAVDVARAALVEVNPDGLGDYVGATSEAPFTVTHRFVADMAGYRGWHWVCVLALVPGDARVTVDEIALLPGPDALVAPEWVPWEKRIQPGDLGAGDLLPPADDDERLVPGQWLSGDEELDDAAAPIGLGRKQHLSMEGRADAAERWFAERGPSSEIAKGARHECSSCGFLVPLAGALGTMFGVCANQYSQDGQVVSLRFGCGAHSEVSVNTDAAQPVGEAYDDAAVDVVVLPQQLEGARRGRGEESAEGGGEGGEMPAENSGEASGEEPTEKPADERSED